MCEYVLVSLTAALWLTSAAATAYAAANHRLALFLCRSFGFTHGIDSTQMLPTSGWAKKTGKCEQSV